MTAKGDFFRAAIPDVVAEVNERVPPASTHLVSSIPLGSGDNYGGSKDYWELEGSPRFQMRASAIERLDVVRRFLCRTHAIPTLIEDADRGRLPWGNGPSYVGELVMVELEPVGQEVSGAGSNVAEYEWWIVSLGFGSTAPVRLNNTVFIESVTPTFTPNSAPADLQIYVPDGGVVSRAGLYEGIGTISVRLEATARNARFFNVAVLGMTGSINASPLVTAMHGVIAPRRALFIGGRTAVVMGYGLLPRWDVSFVWSVRMTPWDCPVGLEFAYPNLAVRFGPMDEIGSQRYVVQPFMPYPLADHNMIYGSVG